MSIVQNLTTSDIKVGKFTLESLTTGMYAEPLVIYREYIQNSCDAIDLAINKGIFKSREDGKIHINVSPENKEIQITDNGIGIPKAKVWSILGDIGRSEKISGEQRGFRGIGRLGGMTYCNKLVFETSFSGENVKSIITWDCEKLREMLKPGEYEEYDIIDVMRDISSASFTKESKTESHYFRVIMTGVDAKYPELLDERKVKTYVAQVAPAPFDKKSFYFSTEILRDFEKLGYTVPQYNIYINEPSEHKRVLKLFKSRVVYKKSQDGKSKNLSDDILKCQIIISSDSSNIDFIGWVGISNLLATIKEKEVCGIRLRKDNIQVGNSSILDELFAEPRFNDYYIGEIHILSKGVIPNARRDDFEKNDIYANILEEIGKTTKNELSKSIRTELKKRQEEKELSQSLEIASDVIVEKVKNGFSSSIEQDIVFEEMDKTKKTLEKHLDIMEKKKKDGNEKKQYDEKIKKIKVVLNQMGNLENEIINNKTDNFITKKLPSSYSRKEKNVVVRIFEIIDSLVVCGDITEEQKKKIVEKTLEGLAK